MTISMDKFITSSGARMVVSRCRNNPNMTDIMDGASHWTCTIHVGRSRMTVPFSQGSAHTKAPELADVLNCLASDASGFENAGSFEEWAADYGYDADSRKAEKTFCTVERQSVKLLNLLGQSAYKTLLWDTERL